MQHLANKFWIKWKNEYLPTLQVCCKWQGKSRNLQVGNIVLLCDKSVHQNERPMGIVAKIYPTDDGLVRRADIHFGKDRKIFFRTVSELIVLLSDKLK